MATLATFFDRILPVRGSLELTRQAHVQELETPYLIRPIPNENVYFYVKRIDNSQVLRQADPATGGICWRLIGSSFAAATVVAGLLLPSVYGLISGYKIESLRHEREQLANEKSALELEESKLLSPERLDSLARAQQFLDPSPQKTVYLDAKPEGAALARR